MGVNQHWHTHFLSAVHELNPQAKLINHGPHKLAILGENLVVQLLSLASQFDPYSLIQLQAGAQKDGKIMVQLWEDVWLWKQMQVLSRIKSFLNLNKSIHGRKAKIKTLSLEQAKDFYSAYHLQGPVGAADNFGLLFENQLVAAASFSAKRAMKSKGDHYTSAELVRFASKDGVTVVGGLSKLIKHFFKLSEFNDLMTYADRDWSLGRGYEQLGFELTAVTPPAELYVDCQSGKRYFPHRLPKELSIAFQAQKNVDLSTFLAANGFVRVFNTGNLKYHFYR